MKEFVKMTLAVLAGLFIFGIVAFFFTFAMVGAVASLGDKQTVMPREAVLKIDMSTFTLSEQSTEANPTKGRKTFHIEMEKQMLGKQMFAGP